jgi:Raf kinase inhibitor-like YbhB/YbcL family protein
MAFQLRSGAFAEGTAIPKKFTCDGQSISPALSWSGAPANAKTLALIMDDPDAPSGTYTHWVLYNIAPALSSLGEAVAGTREVPGVGTQGSNSAGRTGYVGPCPPSGTHRYYFKLFALDANLQLKPGLNARELQMSMGGHILAQAWLMGRFSRQAPPG